MNYVPVRPSRWSRVRVWLLVLLCVVGAGGAAAVTAVHTVWWMGPASWPLFLLLLATAVIPPDED